MTPGRYACIGAARGALAGGVYAVVFVLVVAVLDDARHSSGDLPDLFRVAVYIIGFVAALAVPIGAVLGAIVAALARPLAAERGRGAWGIRCRTPGASPRVCRTGAHRREVLADLRRASSSGGGRSRGLARLAHGT